MVRRMTVIALAGLSASSGAQAFDFDPNVFRFNGFGTIGAVYSSEENADFAGLGFKAKGAGHSDQVSTDVDTRLGLQAVAKFTDKLSATVQVVAEQDIYHSYAPTIEWANLKYAITPDLSVRLGRTAMPSYLYSDSRKVGYSIPWVRAPNEVYQLLPITNSDGVDVSYRFRMGDVTNTVQVILGENVVEVVPGVDAKAEGVWGVFDTVEFGDYTFHATYQGQQLNIEGWPGADLTVKFLALGGRYDSGKWFGAAEWARLENGGAIT